MYIMTTTLRKEAASKSTKFSCHTADYSEYMGTSSGQRGEWKDEDKYSLGSLFCYVFHGFLKHLSEGRTHCIYRDAGN